MIKLLKILITGIICSFFFFSFEFTFLPGINTKMMLAALGLVFVFYTLLHNRDFSASKEFLILFILCSIVSIISLLSIVYNRTPDTAYVSYIISAAVWLSAAFVVCCCIRMTHKRLDVPLIVNYLIAVCLFQGIIAQVIQDNMAVKSFVNAYVNQGQMMLDEMGRIYGIGCSLDVGGSRFAVVLVAIAALLYYKRDYYSVGQMIWLIISFVLITILGNMIARTTIIGTVIGLLFLIIMFGRIMFRRTNIFSGHRLLWTWFVILILAIPISVAIYRSSPNARTQFRFAFEGFFSLAEKGEWETTSTNTLQTMVVWPEELRTWVIGDGYFENSRNDPNYLGNATDQGFYMGTDVGYLRFIFYFGVIGLIAITAVMVYTTVIDARAFPEYKMIFILGLLVGLIVWVKVSTDIFPFLSLFAAASYAKREYDPKPEELEDSDSEDPETLES